MGPIEDNIEAVSERIRAAASRAGRSPGEVRLMVVTKTQPKELVEEAYLAGVRLFGENRIAEAEAKYSGFHPDAELHMIGHLQRNKAAKAAGLVRCVQSIDKVDTAAALQRRCETLDRKLDILFEVNTSREENKEGFRSDDDLFRALDEILEMDRLQPRGLMTVAALTRDREKVRACFRQLAAIRESVRRRFHPNSFDELSMGMTGDFEIAIEEGATLVRVGTAIFGARATQ